MSKFFFGIIRSPEVPGEKVLEVLESAFGPIDTRSPVYDFDQTEYYLGEMGEGLVREFFSLKDKRDPSELTAFKLKCAEIEDKMRKAGNREVNIDPGYMDFYKIVLASFKEGGQKIYMGSGVWADMTLYYKKGKWHTFPWTFPDFALGTYDTYLIKLRETHKTGK